MEVGDLGQLAVDAVVVGDVARDDLEEVVDLAA